MSSWKSANVKNSKYCYRFHFQERTDDFVNIRATSILKLTWASLKKKKFETTIRKGWWIIKYANFWRKCKIYENDAITIIIKP